MTEFASILSIVAIIFSVFCYTQLFKEKKRNRILQSFIAGIITSISNYENKYDTANLMMKMLPNTGVVHKGKREHNKKLPIEYKSILGDIKYNIAEDFGTDLNGKTTQEWLKNNKKIFLERDYENNGFNRIYFDLFDCCEKAVKKDKGE